MSWTALVLILTLVSEGGPRIREPRDSLASPIGATEATDP